MQKIDHEHPLTLTKNSELVCPNCKKHLDESYSCKCRPYRCNFCNERLSGSCYTCKLCWKSPMVHQSCFELSEEILQITNYLPHCLLRLEYRDVRFFSKKPKKKKRNVNYFGTDCDFCNKQHGDHLKYSCGDCGFEIGFKCALKLIKWHEGQQHVKHFSHRHPLTLLTFDDMNCMLCYKKIEGPSYGYGCAPCNFYIHDLCRGKFLPEIRHNFHPQHSLTLGNMDHRCNVCHSQSKVKGLGYRCDKCNFELHTKCITLKPNIKYQGHDHLLILLEELNHYYKCKACCFDSTSDECEWFAEVQYDDIGKLRHFSDDHILIVRDIHGNDDICCYGCGKGVQGSTYGCEPCKFELDLDRASLHPSVNLNVYTDEGILHEGQEKIAHFNHKHHLIFLELEVAGVNCKLCYKNINGQCYGCTQCEFYMHNSCGALQQEIQHPFHPCHSLELLVDEKPGYWCKACCFDIKGLRYRCDDCKFHLHPECASLKPNKKYKDHKHPLILIENMSFQGECEACGLTTLGTFFMRCVECNLNFHVQCGPLPLRTTLQKQHIHPLTLNTKPLAKGSSSRLCCAVCNKVINTKYPTYYCVDCEYHTHMRCVITELQVDEREKIKHFSHRHSLFLLENKRNDDNIVCVACEKIQASPIYGCDECEFYLHKSCVYLPREIQHPFHQHPLSLPNPYSKQSHECSACHKHHYGFNYSCQKCIFNLDLDCSSLFPSIKLQSFHEHNLTFFKKLYDLADCDSESGCIIGRNKSIPLDNYYLRCVRCNFSLHLLCCPLPKTFKHDCHQHSITLKDNFVNLFGDDFDDDEFCCDFCETRRDARECVYHCEECNFVVDLDCLFSEVIQFLEEGNRKDVEWRTVSKKVTKKVKGLTYKDILKSLTEEEKKMMESLTKVEKMIKEGTLRDMFNELKETNRLINKRISVSEELIGEEYLENMAREHVQGTRELKFLEEDADAELVNVGDYKISPKFAPLLKKLLENYGDIVASCPLTQNLKTMLLTTLCGVVQDMRETKVRDIESACFVNWWFLLKLVQRAGFRIDFALDHVKRIADECFLIMDASWWDDADLYKVHEKIAKNSEEIDQLKAKNEDLKKEARDIIYKYSEPSKRHADRINHALGSWWKNAANRLLDDS